MIKSIVLIGSGNVATRLGMALKHSGFKIIQVYSPDIKHANMLARKLRAKSCTILNDIYTEADLYLIAIKDDAIKSVAQQLRTKVSGKIVAHTSGSVSIDILKGVSKNTGVFYPLQTFSKDREIDIKKVPFCIEANNKKTEKLLFELACSISTNVNRINSEQRNVLHVAAVFACNFSNHLFSISEKILKDRKISFDMLKPLIHETVHKIDSHSPAEMQTGPAKRKDKNTINAHLEFLKTNPEYQKIYALLSNSIENSL